MAVIMLSESIKVSSISPDDLDGSVKMRYREELSGGGAGGPKLASCLKHS